MPDLLAGTTILALDTPPTLIAESSDNETDLTSTTYETGTTVVATTFIAGTTGRVKIAWTMRGRGDGTESVLLSYEIYEGTDETGTLVVPTSDDGAVQIVTANTEQQGLTDMKGGLTVGATHFIRLMHKVTGGTTSDIFYRRMVISPAT